VGFAASQNTAVLFYTVTSSPAAFAVNATSSPITISGLAGTFSFFVSATNAFGQGPSTQTTAVSVLLCASPNVVFQGTCAPTCTGAFTLTSGVCIANSGSEGTSISFSITLAPPADVLSNIANNITFQSQLGTTIGIDIAHALNIDPSQVQVGFTINGNTVTTTVVVFPDASGSSLDSATVQQIIDQLLSDPNSPLFPPYAQPVQTITTTQSEVFKCSDSTWSVNCANSPSSNSSSTPLRDQGGFIAGMVIMCIVVTALIIAGVVYYNKHQKKDTPSLNAYTAAVSPPAPQPIPTSSVAIEMSPTTPTTAEPAVPPLLQAGSRFKIIQTAE
jgi:hypothetical protein